MIIIKIILLYFIEVAHTHDFPSTGTRLLFLMLVYFLVCTRLKVTLAITIYSSLVVRVRPCSSVDRALVNQASRVQFPPGLYSFHAKS